MNLNSQIIRRVEDKVIETLLQVQTLYGRAFELPSIEWNLRGVCAGLAQVRENRIRLNPVLLSENTEHFIRQTVPHEIAHLVNRALHGPHVRAHGPEWKSIMHALGLPPMRCHQYDATNVRTRTPRRYAYQCNCRSHPVSQIVHTAGPTSPPPATSSSTMKTRPTPKNPPVAKRKSPGASAGRMKCATKSSPVCSS